jgi:hypothetical protein
MAEVAAHQGKIDQGCPGLGHGLNNFDSIEADHLSRLFSVLSAAGFSSLSSKHCSQCLRE